jgi:hypothetical protein
VPMASAEITPLRAFGDLYVYVATW